MVATVAPAGMPSRQFSLAILGGSWPLTDPQNFHSAAEAQHAKGAQLINCADELRRLASGVAADQSGQFIDGFCNWCSTTAAEYVGDADDFFAMSRVSEEVGRLLYGLREDLDEIDRRAHEEIEQIQQSIGVGKALRAGAQIMAILAEARADATAKAAQTAGEISKLGTQIGISPNAGSGSQKPAGPPPQPLAGADPVEPNLRELQTTEFGGGGGRGQGGMPTGLEPKPLDPPPQPPTPPTPKPDGTRPSDFHGGNQPSPGNGVGNEPVGAGGAEPHRPRPGSVRPDDFGSGSPPGMIPPVPVPATGGGSPVPVSNPGGGGFQMPSTPGGLGGLGGDGLPTQGLMSGAGFNPGGMAPLAGMPPAAPSDFSRGLSAGLGTVGGPAPFVPPVSPPPSTAATSGGPAGALPSGPAPMAGGPAVSPPPTPMAAPAESGMGGAGVPAGPVGPLPPFGSDVPRPPVGSSAAVAPASGPPAAPVAAGGGAGGSSPMAPLPPGVVGSGVGAAAGVATEAIRSSLPDPLLEAASQLVYQLLHDSRMYPYMDWCVGVFRTASGVETVIVNSDGAGYIPVGVFVPRSARMLFADPGLNAEFRARWFSWANPAETMLAYAELATKANPNVELWALAVSTDHGGSSVPARGAAPHFEDCARGLSPLAETAPTSALDDSHMHRLETLDRGSYARLTGFGDGPRPDRSEAWRTTVASAQRVLGRVGAIRDIAVPPVIRQVTDQLSKGLPVPGDKWGALEAAYVEALMYAAGLRPGRMVNDGAASAHVLGYHDLSRLTELLLLWHRDSIVYPEIEYLAKQISLTPHLSGLG
jgi:hypothetical protein